MEYPELPASLVDAIDHVVVYCREAIESPTPLNMGLAALWADELERMDAYSPLHENLTDCISRTISAYRDVAADPKNIKITKAKLWLTNLAGWLPEI